MKKKIMAILMAAVIVLTFGACGSSPASSSGSSGQYGGYDSTLYKVLQSGKITVGVIGAFAPCSYVDEGDVRVWTYTISVGSAGMREFQAGVASADRVFTKTAQTVSIQVRR